jgi:hypothetical protein
MGLRPIAIVFGVVCVKFVKAAFDELRFFCVIFINIDIMEQHTLKNVNNCLNTNIYPYLGHLWTKF